MHDVVIRGGAGFDVAFEGDLIAAVGPELPGGKSEIDARGLTILPGIIDAHVHFNDPGRADWEGAGPGSRALAAGGGTLFVDMPLNSAPCTVDGAGFKMKRAALEVASVTDFALWGGLVPGNAGEMAELASLGVIGFKAFMCNSGLPEFPRANDETLLAGMSEAARLNRPVAVHAESEQMTSLLARRLQRAGRNDTRAFLESRPIAAEVEAIYRAGQIARETGCRLHIVHISCGSGVAAALEERALGADISIETCPHYLFFSEEDLFRIGALAKCTPPLRDLKEQSRLRQAAAVGNIDIIGSDHSPCPPSMKDRENFFEIWGGIAGVQTTLLTLLEIGLPLDRIAATTAANPAKRFGLGNRGAIKVGNRADVTLVDTDTSTAVTEQWMLHLHHVSPYMGHSLRGAIRRTIRGGKTIFADGRITASTGGKFVHA